jgi:tRNA(Ile)-lysidine synthase
LLNDYAVSNLKNTKNLLAFSGGGDSTALFFLLKDMNIDFDIAIVDYGIREQSKDEITYAKEIANCYNKKCFTLDATAIDKNFEANARVIRYNFFEDIIKKFNYDNLLTAHHLGDRFEWMLMQFCKGAGCIEIAGMQSVEKRDNYTLIRPLLDIEKSELLNYLNKNGIKYFEDETNLDENYKRNSFRHNISNPLLEKYKDGIKKSFEYIDADRDELIKDIQIIQIDDFAYFKSSNSKRADIYTIDQYIKSIGNLMSASERELLKNNTTVIIGRKYLVNQDKGFVFIAPYVNQTIKMDKEFKEEMRSLKIDAKLRVYLHQNKKIYLKIKNLFN